MATVDFPKVADLTQLQIDACSAASSTGLKLSMAVTVCWFIVAGIYLVLTVSLSLAVGQLEKKMNVAHKSNNT